MPSDDAKPVVEGCLQSCPVETPIWIPRHANERIGTGVRLQDYGQEAIHLIYVTDQLRTCGGVFSSNPKSNWLPVLKVQLPFSAARSEERVAVSDVADGLVVRLPRLPTNDEGKHEALAQWRRHREAEHDPHRHIDDSHDAGL